MTPSRNESIYKTNQHHHNNFVKLPKTFFLFVNKLGRHSRQLAPTQNFQSHFLHHIKINFIFCKNILRPRILRPRKNCIPRRRRGRTQSAEVKCRARPRKASKRKHVVAPSYSRAHNRGDRIPKWLYIHHRERWKNWRYQGRIIWAGNCRGCAAVSRTHGTAESGPCRVKFARRHTARDAMISGCREPKGAKDVAHRWGPAVGIECDGCSRAA